jgi:hypothetical protein
MRRRIAGFGVLVLLSILAGKVWGQAKYSVTDLGVLSFDSYGDAVNAGGEAASC